MSECKCILQKTSFKIWKKHSWLYNLWSFGGCNYEYVITIHADNLTDLDKKIDEIKNELRIKHPDYDIRDFAL